MGNSFVYSSDMRSLDMETEEKTKKKDKKLLLIKIIVIILCLVLFAELVLYTLIIPNQRQVTVTFSGLQTYTTEEMYDLLGSEKGKTWMTFDSSAVALRYTNCPWIKSVVVEKHFPSTVHISVQERIPIATTLLNMNGKTVPVCIDETGVLFSAKEGMDVSHLPILSGLPITHFSDGMKLSSEYQSLVFKLAELQQLPQKYLSVISEIHINEPKHGGFDLTLYPIKSNIRILMDRNLSEDSLQYMVVALDVVNSLAADITEIDLRYGSVSYRYR